MTPGPTGVRRHAHVDLDCIAANALTGASDRGSPLSHLTVDLRADAYGHGLIPVALRLSAAGVGGFVVSRVEDAAALADAGVTATVTIASAAHSGSTVSPEAPLGPAIFGLDPTQPAPPAMRLVGEVIAVKRVGAGRGVSYGYTYRTSRPTTLALIALGFADGIPRVATNRAPVRVGDFTGRVTGRIAMDQFVVDLDGTLVEVGETAVLFGDPERGEPSVLDWADVLGLAAPVITSRLGRRIERVYDA